MTRRVDGKEPSSIETFDAVALGEGSVTVAVVWSTVSYKDGLALAGAHIMLRYPLIDGIDSAGTLARSDHPDLRLADRVLANSRGLCQTHHGGYAKKARVRAGSARHAVPGAWHRRRCAWWTMFVLTWTRIGSKLTARNLPFVGVG